MTENITRIGILEPSAIIFEGLSNILFKGGDFELFRIDGFSDLSKTIKERGLKLMMINPMFVQTNLKEFITLKKKHPGVVWLAILYAFFDKAVKESFDAHIPITGQPGQIINEVNRCLFAEETIGEQEATEQLSDRETDVLKLLVTGLSNKEVADRLNISIHTVISHRKNITLKTGIKTQSGLTIYAISNRLISL